MLTLYEYQLAMLDAMCESAPVEADALLRSLGVTRSAATSAMLRFRSEPQRSLDEYLAAWRTPDSMSVEPLRRDLEMRTVRWDLTFWPDLQLELSSPRQSILFRRFVRHPELPRPRLDSPGDLAPWSCTYDELVGSNLAPIDHVDGMGGTGDVAAFAAMDPDSGQNRVYWAYFDWSLLQSVEPAPDRYVWAPGSHSRSR
ncbi:hypothetical protein ACWF82_18140 [Nocardia sp. NPDC055053]